MIVNGSKVNEVNGISKEQKEAILIYLQGAVYCWCKNRKDEWFAARDLLGGDNFFWQGTPLYTLYQKSSNVEQAGKDAGWLLKKMVNNDKRTFETRKSGLVREYRWTGVENNI